MNIRSVIKEIAAEYSRRVPMQLGFFLDIINDIPESLNGEKFRHFEIARELQKFQRWATQDEMRQFFRLCEEVANADISAEDESTVRQIYAVVVVHYVQPSS